MPELYFSQGYQKPSDFLSPLGPEKTVALCQANQISLNAWLEPALVFSLSEMLTGTTAACCLNRLNRNERHVLCNVVGTCGNESLALAAFL